MISFLFLSPQIQDGDHYVKRPPPLRKSRRGLHAIIIMLLKLFFQAPWNLEYISITNFLNRMCLSTQNPTWLPYWLALLAQMPRISDVQLLFHMGI